MEGMRSTSNPGPGPGAVQEPATGKRIRFQLSLFTLLLGALLFGGSLFAGTRWCTSLFFGKVPLWGWCACLIVPWVLFWVLVINRLPVARGRRLFGLQLMFLHAVCGLSTGTLIAGHEMGQVSSHAYSRAIHAIYRFGAREKRLPNDYTEIPIRDLEPQSRDLFDRHVFEYQPPDAEQEAHLVWHKFDMWGPRGLKMHTFKLAAMAPEWEMPARPTWYFWGLEAPEELSDEGQK